MAEGGRGFGSCSRPATPEQVKTMIHLFIVEWAEKQGGGVSKLPKCTRRVQVAQNEETKGVSK